VNVVSACSASVVPLIVQLPGLTVTGKILNWDGLPLTQAAVTTALGTDVGGGGSFSLLHMMGGVRLLLVEFGEEPGLRKNWIAGTLGVGIVAGLAFALALIG